MNSKLFLGLVSVPLLGLLLWTASIEYKSRVLPEVTVRMQGFDPRSLLSGHYISYRIDWKQTDCTQFSDNKCPEEDFLNSGFDSWNDFYGNHRFYIPQEKARDLDRMFRESGRSGDVFEVVYAYKKGFRPVAKKLLINGEDWQIALRKDKEQKKQEQEQELQQIQEQVQEQQPQEQEDKETPPEES